MDQAYRDRRPEAGVLRNAMLRTLQAAELAEPVDAGSSM